MRAELKATPIWAAPAMTRCGARIVATFDGRFFGHDPSGPGDHVHECDLDADHAPIEDAIPDDWHLCRCGFRWP